MLKYLTIFISSLLLLAGFWSLFYSQKNIHYWLVAIAVAVILLSGRILSRNILFLLLLISEEWRYLLSLVLSLLWMLIWWLLAKYFENIDNIENSNYLVVNKFFYYLAFWFLATSLYSLVIFIHFPLLYAYLICIVFTFFWLVDIVRYQDNFSWVNLIFSLFILSQILVAVYLLPVSFYVAGTIATLWFFFIIDNTANTLRSFKLYLGLFLLITILLLTTSII